MKRSFLVIYAFTILPFLSSAQAPAGYYNTATGLSGDQLKIALRNIIRPHTTLSYTPGLWDAYYTTDKKPDGKLWDIYSDIPGGTAPYEFTLGTDQCSGSSPSGENGCYNREHTWPQSKFNSTPPMYSDLYIVYPTDYYVNSKRGDLPYGKAGTPLQNTFMNGSKIGPNTYPGAPTGECFEPIDSFKGDIARNYFYVATCYWADSTAFIDWEMAAKVNLKPWTVQMLLEWHHNDPVSQKEINRNNAVYALQGNRNPFIDEPGYADCIWGTGNCALGLSQPAGVTAYFSVYPNPANSRVNIAWTATATELSVYTVQGRLLYNKMVSGQNTAIETSHWAKGVYFIQLLTPQGPQCEKLVIE